MISYEEACQTILNESPLLAPVRVKLESLLGSVLAEPVVARGDSPLFDNSAVDGFGVYSADIAAVSKSSPVPLTLVGTIQAGDAGDIYIEPGQTVKILTGAPVPACVEAVVMREETEEKKAGEQESQVYFHCPTEPGDNIRRRGEEFRRGDTVLPSGITVTPPVIGLLASLGYASMRVYKKPSVGLLVTGNELIKPGLPLVSGKIYESNSYALMAALESLGIDQVRVYYAKDDLNETYRSMKQALQANDVVISIGGVSVGDYDFVKDVAAALQIQTQFWGIALKPGKPVYFGTYTTSAKPKLVFGLPGNPVSALVTFHQLVQPALLKMMGALSSTAVQLEKRVRATLTQEVRKKPGRLELIRGILTQPSGHSGIYRVTPAQGQDSHMLGGLSQANCLIVFPTEASRLGEGEEVSVDLLSWSPLSSVEAEPHA